MNRLVELLRNSGRNIEIKVERFSSVVGISELGDQPFVSVLHFIHSIRVLT